jgi:hypothetical protein
LRRPQLRAAATAAIPTHICVVAASNCDAQMQTVSADAGSAQMQGGTKEIRRRGGAAVCSCDFEGKSQMQAANRRPASAGADAAGSTDASGVSPSWICVADLKLRRRPASASEQ